MPDQPSYPYATHLNVLYAPLELVDVQSLVRNSSLLCLCMDAESLAFADRSFDWGHSAGRAAPPGAALPAEISLTAMESNTI